MVREADVAAAVASRRADVSAQRAEVQSLKDKINQLERDLVRAKRCLAAERAGRERLRVRLMESERVYALAVGVLCRFLPPVDP